MHTVIVTASCQKRPAILLMNLDTSDSTSLGPRSMIGPRAMMGRDPDASRSEHPEIIWGVFDVRGEAEGAAGHSASATRRCKRLQVFVTHPILILRYHEET